ncbi:MAG: phytanoyl-CoA hydroxylase [Acidobacteriota bacterium]|jgi:ectoine hydroxylase-related dioxygenase (phytanoyl-CoA dioxygenase family)|nr:phytanoyl-CoA hydroxylase [Acidobacteriota bacterium]
MLGTISKLFRGSQTLSEKHQDNNGAAKHTTSPDRPLKRFLSQAQVDFYNEHGYLRIPEVYTSTETDELQSELDRLIQEWAFTDKGWTGPWRQVYMDAETEEKSKLVAMHDLQLYSETWCRAITNSNLTAAMSDLLGPNVELHHSTLHVKPPETGHPFPMHQDWAFYHHENGQYIDALIHLSDTSDENGEIRFLDGSHKQGALEHITETPEGPCTPHLPTDQYRLEDTIPVPARRGDVVCFNIHTIHGSYINQTKEARLIVRVGYRDPLNLQTFGQSLGRPGVMVRGYRTRLDGQPLLKQE